MPTNWNPKAPHLRRPTLNVLAVALLVVTLAATLAGVITGDMRLFALAGVCGIGCALCAIVA